MSAQSPYVFQTLPRPGSNTTPERPPTGDPGKAWLGKRIFIGVHSSMSQDHLLTGVQVDARAKTQ